jgi:hypothetical protein
MENNLIKISQHPVSKLFRKHVVRDIMKKKNEILLEDYDEFDMT